MRRHVIRKKDYEKVLSWLKEKAAEPAPEPSEKEEEKMGEVPETGAARAFVVPPEHLPKIGWARHGPFQARKLKHGKDAIFVKEGPAFKRLVHDGEIDAYLRDAMLLPESVVPLARDTGYHIVQKATVGISRRAVAAFLAKQEVVQLTKQQNPRMKQPGRPLEGRGYLELDLIEAKGADIGKWVHHPVKNFYFISMIDRLTGWIEIERSPNKFVKTVAPKIRSMLERMRRALGTRIKYIRSDAGSEFKAETQEVFKELKIRSKFVKSGNRIENANRVYQRIWYRLLRLGRGDLGPLTSQAVGIFNNTKSTINGFTPLEALKEPDAVLSAAFNASRKKIAKYKGEAIVKGDKVRFLIDKVVGKHTKALGYKSYRGLHWSAEVHEVVNINSTTGKFYVGGEWRTRDKLLKVSGVDKETKRRVDETHNETRRKRREKMGAAADLAF